MHANLSQSTITGKTKIKIVFLGNQSVGKSCIIDKYVNDKFDQHAHPTVGIDFLAKNIIYKTKNYRLQLWDTAGQERFKSLIPGYLRDAQCSLIVFDVSSRNSLNTAENWLHLYNQNKTGDGFTILVGNKIDLVDVREVKEEEGKSKARELGVLYYEISAKDGTNIEELFSNIVQICTEKSIEGANFSLLKSVPVLTNGNQNNGSQLKSKIKVQNPKDIIEEDEQEGKGQENQQKQKQANTENKAVHLKSADIKKRTTQPQLKKCC